MTRLELSMLTVSAGRVEGLLRKLAALERQRLEPGRFELVLVDNACPDRVGEAVERRRWPFPVRVLRNRERQSAALARCRAAAAAAAPLVWLSDDDCLPDPEAASRHLAQHTGAPSAVIGAVRFVTDGAQHTHRPRRVGPAQLSGANASLPREAMLRACRVPIELPRSYGGEDIVLGLLLRDQGLRFVAAPDAVVEHEGPNPTWGDDPRKGFDAGYNAVVIARHWPREAWTLGVHRVQLAFKQLVLATPEARLGHRLMRTRSRSGGGRYSASNRCSGRWRYERAYLEGSLAARRAGLGGPT